jgi:hypothetical protein
MGDNIPHEVLQQGGFIGPRFTGVFFFEDIFWRVAIPLVFGTPNVNTMDALRIMPPDVKQRLCARRDTVREYLMLWADCYDYDTGYQDSHTIFATGAFLGEMIESTERELTSAISDLCQQRPNSKAMHSARDATEKAIKAYLAYHANLTPERAKKHFGHKLDIVIQEVTRHAPTSALVEVQKDLDAFAPYEDRYTSSTYTRPQLWRAYRLAQYTTAEVLRTITGRNQRAAVRCHPVFNDA